MSVRARKAPDGGGGTSTAEPSPSLSSARYQHCVVVLEDNINVQHIIITTEQAELGTNLTSDVEMTTMQVVQSETGELAVTMIVDTDSVEAGAGVLQVVTTDQT